MGEDGFDGEGFGEGGDGGHFEEEVDGEFAVDGVAVCGELVGPGEEGGGAAGGLGVGEGGEEVRGVAGEAGDVEDGAEDGC